MSRYRVRGVEAAMKRGFESHRLLREPWSSGYDALLGDTQRDEPDAYGESRVPPKTMPVRNVVHRSRDLIGPKAGVAPGLTLYLL